MATLQPGANVSLTREVPNLSGVVAAVGWTTDGDPAIVENLTPAAIVCGSDGRALSNEHVVFFNQSVSADLSTALVKCTSDYDKAHFDIDLAACDPQVDRIAIVLYLNEAIGARRTLAQLRRCHARVLNLARTQMVASGNLTDTFTSETAAVLAEVYRHRDEWKFKVTAQGYPNIDPLLERYGVRR